MQPRLVVVMGDEALDILNDSGIPLARELLPSPGEIQRFTPSIDGLFTPDIDDSLDDDASKRAFWQAFRVLGDWYADFPPY